MRDTQDIVAHPTECRFHLGREIIFDLNLNRENGHRSYRDLFYNHCCDFISEDNSYKPVTIFCR